MLNTWSLPDFGIHVVVVVVVFSFLMFPRISRYFKSCICNHQLADHSFKLIFQVDELTWFILTIKKNWWEIPC